MVDFSTIINNKRVSSSYFSFLKSLKAEKMRPTNEKTVYQMRNEKDKHKRKQYARELFELLWKEMTAIAPIEVAEIVDKNESKLKAPDLDV